MRKLDKFIQNASTDHVLEVGTGWGSLAIRAAEETGCRVTSVTLSRGQKDVATKRIAAAGFAKNIKVLLCDLSSSNANGKILRQSSKHRNTFGRRSRIPYHFACVDKWLRPKGGIAIFQCITMPETRYEGYTKGENFIRKYIFPGDTYRR